MKDVIIKNFTCGYEQKTVFENFGVTFGQGKINVVLGGSGVGKTTLLNALAGLKTYEGSIEGCEDGVSYIFQKDRLIPSISVYKNLDLVLKGIVKDKNERKSRIEKTAKDLEIFDVLKKLPSEISGGQAQRVSMARALLYPCGVLLLDEPFKALDVALKNRLIKQFVALQEESKKTVIFVTHAIDECLLCADDYFVFSSSPVEVVLRGNIPSNKSERKLTDQDLDDVRKELLGAFEQMPNALH